MVHSLIPMSVDIKTRIFETPARLVNAMELTCAIGMAYSQAGLPQPEAEAGTALKTFWEQAMLQIDGNNRIKENLQIVIRSYIFKKEEQIDEDCRISMRMGYEFH